MTESSRRRFLKTAAGGALTGGALLLPGGTAQAAAAQAALETHHRHRHRHLRQQEPGADPDLGDSPGGDPGGNPPLVGASTTYELTVVNNSTNFVDFAVYQTPVDLGVPNVLPLAWLTAPAWPTTTVRFDWTPDYSFVWSETGRLVPGVVFKASQVWPADLTGHDGQQVQFTYDQGAFTFRHGDTGGSPRPGNLYVRQTGSVPIGSATVGIGMSGAGTFAVQAEPNQNLVFTPHPQYWITAGSYEAGQVLDVEEIGNSARLDFEGGTRLTATLGVDNTWRVVPTLA